MEDRLNHLEELYLTQTHTIEQMSLEVFQQQKEIAGLKQQIEALKEKVEEDGAEVDGPERPPHY